MNYAGKEIRDQLRNDLCTDLRPDPAIRKILSVCLVAILPFNVWQLYALIVGKITDPSAVKLTVLNLILYATLTLLFLLDWKFQFVWKRRLQVSKK